MAGPDVTQMCLVRLLPFLSCICTEQDREIEPNQPLAAWTVSSYFMPHRVLEGEDLGFVIPR